ncbi:excinuclease ABC subunit C [Paenibacillus segetis]|uniref:Excinuclease ABC subunit C n=2 Tax=Paenibacillus segetis TaxID=1325360 RepID=A0ABQ1YES5_9BACL|nr:GIY-YIG nuclease family protein [Paenibacillus segetis]GGH23563.1 excinuclease ABC subunit C [Paenibacillus segetis]
MKDSRGNILYVGKSKHLKNRVQSYFHNSKSHSPKIKKLVNHVKDLEYILTDTEFEAFMLECQLIHGHKPMYNRKMKNPLAYQYIAIWKNEGLNRLEVTNDPFSNDDYQYFGPYTANKNSVEKAIQGIKGYFKIDCNQSVTTKGACLNHSLGLCLGMCLGGEALAQYNHIINRLIALLDGTDPSLYEEMNQGMLAAAEQYDFEKAARYRDYIGAVTFLLNKEKVIDFVEENRNIVVVEYLTEDLIKLFLIKRNRILFCGKYSVAPTGMVSLYEKIRTKILDHFEIGGHTLSNGVSRDEIDEAQIIYSYLQGSSSKYIIIPDHWLNSKDHTKMDTAIQDLFRI